jgi:hypothetical protein
MLGLGTGGDAVFVKHDDNSIGVYLIRDELREIIN